MAPAEFTFDKDVLPVVRKWAAKRFARDRDCETKCLDAESVAWEFFQANPAAKPTGITWYALRRVSVDRQFRQSERSIDGPNPRRKVRPGRETIDLEAISRPGDNPAEIAAFRIDFPEWLSQLTDRQLAMLEALALGERTRTVAETFGCTDGNVSQFRRRLAESWQAFTD